MGDVYPEHFYQLLPSELRDSLCKLTETTKKDLLQVEKKLVELGVCVRRPSFTNVDDFLVNEKLIKPPICPRDWACVLGDTLYITPQYESGVEPFQDAIDLYKARNQNVHISQRFSDISDPWCWVVFPSVVRVGRDIFVDYPKHETTRAKNNLKVCEQLSKNYRVHVTHTNDHSDGVFCPVAPGLIFSTHYKTNYQNTFPNWDIFFLKNTTSNKRNSIGWYRPDHYLPYYSNALVAYAQDWLGNANETVFEVNMLIVDEKNVICIAEDDYACKKLESLGITPHVVNFKTRGFWDGGIHCITLDIRRRGEILDYWPDRGDNGIYFYE